MILLSVAAHDTHSMHLVFYRELLLLFFCFQNQITERIADQIQLTQTNFLLPEFQLMTVIYCIQITEI